MRRLEQFGKLCFALGLTDAEILHFWLIGTTFSSVSAIWKPFARNRVDPEDRTTQSWRRWPVFRGRDAGDSGCERWSLSEDLTALFLQKPCEFTAFALVDLQHFSRKFRAFFLENVWLNSQNVIGNNGIYKDKMRGTSAPFAWIES